VVIHKVFIIRMNKCFKKTRVVQEILTRIPCYPLATWRHVDKCAVCINPVFPIIGKIRYSPILLPAFLEFFFGSLALGDVLDYRLAIEVLVARVFNNQ
jgi:hypothetical protein